MFAILRKSSLFMKGGSVHLCKRRFASLLMSSEEDKFERIEPKFK